MSIEISQPEIMNAYLNPLVSRQVMLKIKNNTIAFVLEPAIPEFVERQRGMSRTADPKWKGADPYGADRLGLLPSDRRHREMRCSVVECGLRQLGHALGGLLRKRRSAPRAL